MCSNFKSIFQLINKAKTLSFNKICQFITKYTYRLNQQWNWQELFLLHAWKSGTHFLWFLDHSMNQALPNLDYASSICLSRLFLHRLSHCYPSDWFLDWTVLLRMDLELTSLNTLIVLEPVLWELTIVIIDFIIITGTHYYGYLLLTRCTVNSRYSNNALWMLKYKIPGWTNESIQYME